MQQGDISFFNHWDCVASLVRIKLLEFGATSFRYKTRIEF